MTRFALHPECGDQQKTTYNALEPVSNSLIYPQGVCLGRPRRSTLTALSISRTTRLATMEVRDYTKSCEYSHTRHDGCIEAYLKYYPNVNRVNNYVTSNYKCCAHGVCFEVLYVTFCAKGVGPKRNLYWCINYTIVSLQNRPRACPFYHLVCLVGTYSMQLACFEFRGELRTNIPRGNTCSPLHCYTTPRP